MSNRKTINLNASPDNGKKLVSKFYLEPWTLVASGIEELLRYKKTIDSDKIGLHNCVNLILLPNITGMLEGFTKDLCHLINNNGEFTLAEYEIDPKVMNAHGWVGLKTCLKNTGDPSVWSLINNNYDFQIVTRLFELRNMFGHGVTFSIKTFLQNDQFTHNILQEKYEKTVEYLLGKKLIQWENEDGSPRVTYEILSDSVIIHFLQGSTGFMEVILDGIKEEYPKTYHHFNKQRHYIQAINSIL